MPGANSERYDNTTLSVQPRMFHDGLSVLDRAACVKTVSPGRRLTRPAPLRRACCCMVEIPLRPLRLLRMLPASLIVSFSLNFRGGAKSSPVKVPPWLRTCLLRCEQVRLPQG